MDNVDIIYMDDDFNFDNIDDEVLSDVESIEKINVEDETLSNNNENDLEVIEIESNDSYSTDIYKDTYSIIDNYNNMKNNLTKRNNELNLFKIKYETLENEKVLLEKKYNNEVNNNKQLTSEIKTIRKELIEKNKDILMLKTLLELIIKKYGIQNICRITRLNEEQINKYLK